MHSKPHCKPLLNLDVKMVDWFNKIVGRLVLWIYNKSMHPGRPYEVVIWWKLQKPKIYDWSKHSWYLSDIVGILYHVRQLELLLLIYFSWKRRKGIISWEEKSPILFSSIQIPAKWLIFREAINEAIKFKCNDLVGENAEKKKGWPAFRLVSTW